MLAALRARRAEVQGVRRHRRRVRARLPLTDHTGKPRTLADYRGKAVVVFFGYTQCPDVCPTTLAELAEVMKQLGPDADRVQVLFVTVDPERDTPELLAQYVPAFDPRFVGLYGDAAATERVGEGIQGHLPEAAGRDARQLHGGPLGGHLHFRPAGPAAPVRELRTGSRRLRARPARTAARAVVNHSITSSARTISDCGSVSPSAFAVLTLMISSNFVGCSTGRSAGLAPLRILST